MSARCVVAFLAFGSLLFPVAALAPDAPPAPVEPRRCYTSLEDGSVACTGGAS